MAGDEGEAGGVGVVSLGMVAGTVMVAGPGICRPADCLALADALAVVPGRHPDRCHRRG
ncbi:hypothetical protein [Kitasatospora putterlickiae]|uniref:hypothetical protein n=1 Tax=Kitasatospora putterlickiae TaxID=221725 RepID=UPI0031D6FBDD